MNRSRSLRCIVVLAVAAACADRAHASCNLIPGTRITYGPTNGSSTNRPFASPREFIDVTGPNPSVQPLPSDPVVTVVFAPTGTAKRWAVVLGTDCSTFDAQRAACEASLGGGTAVCDPDPGAVSPRTDLPATLTVRFPETSALVDGDPRHTITGPISIAVTTPGAPLPCGLATSTCDSTPGLAACVDVLETDGAVDADTPHLTALPHANDFAALESGAASEIRMATDLAGNLLVPIDWSGILVARRGELGCQDESNPARPCRIPVPRLVSTLSGVARDATGDPIEFPGPGFLRSLTPEGRVLPPIFSPRGFAGDDPTQAVLFGSADAPHTVLRFARRSSRTCEGHPERACVDDRDCLDVTGALLGACGAMAICGDTAVECDADDDCPGSACGRPLFDFGDRQFGVESNGPIVVARDGSTGGVCSENADRRCTTADECASGSDGTCEGFSATAETAVPLEGLVATRDAFAFVVDESIQDTDLDGDGAADDQVLTLRGERTFDILPIGRAPSPGTDPAPGRPVVLAPFTTLGTTFPFPAVVSETLRATDRQAVAFLEATGADPALSVARVTGSGASIEADLIAPASPATVFERRALAISEEQVFTRDPAGVLQVLDLSTPMPQLTSLLPATQVAVAAGRAAFLLPEAPLDRNADGDTADTFLAFWNGRGTTPIDLRREAVAVALSPEVMAALVPDATSSTATVHVRSLARPGLRSIRRHASRVHGIGVAGTRAVYVADDGTLAVYDVPPRRLEPVLDDLGRRQPATEFVLGNDLVAFRSSEAARCPGMAAAACATPPSSCVACDLNGDGDCCDDVLQAFSFPEARVVRSGFAVTPCTFEACDPRQPYRAIPAGVKYLTNERDQNCTTGQIGTEISVTCAGGAGAAEYVCRPGGDVGARPGLDLNDDGDSDDLVIQVLDVKTGCSTPVGAVDPRENTGRVRNPLVHVPLSDIEEEDNVFATDAGRCVEPRPGSCAPGTCAPGETCVAGEQGSRCVRIHGTCVPNDADGVADCPAGVPCEPDIVIVALGGGVPPRVDCGSVADDFDRILCRIAALAGDVGATPEDTFARSYLLRLLDRARTNVIEARALAADPTSGRRPGVRFKTATTRVIRFAHRLRSLHAKRDFTDPVRESLIARGESLAADMQAMLPTI